MLVVRIPVIVALEVGDKGLVLHYPRRADGTILPDDSPGEERGVGIRELIGLALWDVVSLERIILDELGAYSAVQGLVQVLEENS